MKTIILTLSTIFLFACSSKSPQLKDNDSIMVKNGYGDTTRISYTITHNKTDCFKRLNYTLFDSICQTISIEAKRNCKNQTTYTPKCVLFTINGDVIDINLKFFAKNSFGVDGELHLITQFLNPEKTKYEETLENGLWVKKPFVYKGMRIGKVIQTKEYVITEN